MRAALTSAAGNAVGSDETTASPSTLVRLSSSNGSLDRAFRIALGDLITRSVKDNLSPHRFLDELLSIESGRREERRIRTSLRLSGLPAGQMRYF